MEHVQRDREAFRQQPHSSITIPTCVDRESPQLPRRSNTEPHTDLEKLRKPGRGKGGGASGRGPSSVDPADSESSKVKNTLGTITEDFAESSAAPAPPSSAPGSAEGSRPPLKHTYSTERPEGPYASSRLLFSTLQPDSAGLLRSTSIYNSFDSDSAYPSLPSSEEQSHQPSVRCPPVRKQFLRAFMKVLKKSSTPRTKQPKQNKKAGEDTQEFPLDEPTDVAMDTLWNELQGYIHDRSPEEQQQLTHDSQERIGQVLHQVRRLVDTTMEHCTSSDQLSGLYRWEAYLQCSIQLVVTQCGEVCQDLHVHVFVFLSH